MPCHLLQDVFHSAHTVVQQGPEAPCTRPSATPRPGHPLQGAWVSPWVRHTHGSPLTAQVLLGLAQLPQALHVEAQQRLLQVPRAAGTHKVPEGAADTLPAALHREGAQAQLPAMEKGSCGGQAPVQAPGDWGLPAWPRVKARKGRWIGGTDGAPSKAPAGGRRPRKDSENLPLVENKDHPEPGKGDRDLRAAAQCGVWFGLRETSFPAGRPALPPTTAPAFLSLTPS